MVFREKSNGISFSEKVGDVCGMSSGAVKQSESTCALVVRGFEFEFGKLIQEFP